MRRRCDSRPTCSINPTRAGASSYANALRNSGAGALLLPYRIHRAGRLLMPADRRITVSFTGGEFNRFGEFVPAPVTLNLWATQLQDGVTRKLEGFGAYGVASRAYRIRYNVDLVRAVEAGLSR